MIWGPNIASGRIANSGNQRGEKVESSWASISTLLVTEFVKAVTDGLTNTETTEKPVIRVAPIVVDGSTVALVVAAVLASRCGSALREFPLRRTR